MTLGEMISFLPIPGAVFTLANRALSPAIVRNIQDCTDSIGFRRWIFVFLWLRFGLSKQGCSGYPIHTILACHGFNSYLCHDYDLSCHPDIVQSLQRPPLWRD
jgi:hypothetical protein